jgi:hypothetical protein
MNIAQTQAEASRPDAAAVPVFRHCRSDAMFIVLALAHGSVLLLGPPAWAIALGLWWNSNTIAHYFIHLPFFRARRMNQIFSAYLSALLGVPQTLWRQRHLAHHAGARWRLQITPQLCVESLIISGVWTALSWIAPRFFLANYLPGSLLGLGFCWLHGYWEHARGTTSHYGLLYNWLFFNDGYHVEHHIHPAMHWRMLPTRRQQNGGSKWPAVLRWMEILTLDSLERLVLGSPRLQRFVLTRHEQAFQRILPTLSNARRVGIVGGALFPRTALILRRLLPHAQLTIIDAAAANIQLARRFLGEEVRFENTLFDAEEKTDFDLLVIPLSFIGDRQALYRQPPAAAVVVHDWLWRRRGQTAQISFALMKRLNLVVSKTARFQEDESA